MASKRVEAEAISSLKALAQNSHSIPSEHSPGHSKSQGQPDLRTGKTCTLHEWNNICVTEGRKDCGYLRKTSTTISVDEFKTLTVMCIVAERQPTCASSLGGLQFYICALFEQGLQDGRNCGCVCSSVRQSVSHIPAFDQYLLKE